MKIIITIDLDDAANLPPAERARRASMLLDTAANRLLMRKNLPEEWSTALDSDQLTLRTTTHAD